MQTLFRLCLTRVTPHFALWDFSYNKGAPLTYTKNLPTDVNEYAIDWGAPWPRHISLCDFVCVSDNLQDSAPQQYVRAATKGRQSLIRHTPLALSLCPRVDLGVYCRRVSTVDEMPDPGPAWWRHGGLVEGNTGRVCCYNIAPGRGDAGKELVGRTDLIRSHDLPESRLEERRAARPADRGLHEDSNVQSATASHHQRRGSRATDAQRLCEWAGAERPLQL